MNRIEQFKKDLKAKLALKVIAGIDNYDIESVKRVVSAADMGGASAVDVAAREDIIYIAKELSNIAVCVSSIEPEKLLMAKENGADMLEIGNFDAMYKKGMRVTSEEILDITSRTIDLVGHDIFLSVTVPGHIDINEQIELAKKLEEMGVDLIQTEGACVANVSNTGARGLLEKANVSIANTISAGRLESRSSKHRNISADTVSALPAYRICPPVTAARLSKDAAAIGLYLSVNTTVSGSGRTSGTGAGSVAGIFSGSTGFPRSNINGLSSNPPE